jgi:hypothetical protein
MLGAQVMAIAADVTDSAKCMPWPKFELAGSMIL